MRVLYFLSVLCVSFPAYAGGDSVEVPIDWDFAKSSKDKCSDGTMIDMNSCLSNEYSRFDEKLNATYQNLVSLLEDKTKLKASQSAWLRFRDLTCEFANSGVDKAGSIYPFAQNACLIDLTAKRIRDLEEYLSWDCNGCPPRK